MKDITIPARYVDERQRVWRPYNVRFTGPDGVYEFYIQALSIGHAELLLEDIRATATVVGEVIAHGDT